MPSSITKSASKVAVTHSSEMKSKSKHGDPLPVATTCNKFEAKALLIISSSIHDKTCFNSSAYDEHK